MKTIDLATIQGKDLILDVSKLVSDEVLYINATNLALQFGKDRHQLFKFLKSKNFLEYKEAYFKVVKSDHFKTQNLEALEIKKGKYGGTYIHSDLIIHFLRWLNVEFAVRCDMYIKQVIQEIHNDKITADATAKANQANIQWLEARGSAKATRKSLTNAIKSFCNYAEVQRGKSYPVDGCKYHILFTKMIYKALDIQKPKGNINPRNVFTGAIVEKIEHLEIMLIRLIYTHIKKDTEYHEAFKSIKQSINNEVQNAR